MTISKSAQAPLVVVVGATGNQGGSVVKHLGESDREYRLRAPTRDVSKATSRGLVDQGIEVVELDLRVENKAKMVEAFTGASVVFAVTNFWEHMDAERETVEGKTMVDAAIEAKVGLFIFSGLPSCSALSGGKYDKVVHFESKARVDDYGRSKISSSFLYRTVHASIYTSGFQGTGNPSFFEKVTDGNFCIDLPAPNDLIDERCVPVVYVIGDFGLWVRAIIEVKEVRDDARPVMTASDNLKICDLCAALARATGKSFEVKSLTRSEYKDTFPAGTPAWMTDDMVDIWSFALEQGYYGNLDAHWADKYLARRPITFEDWLKSVDLSFYLK